jgi:tight adherence protein C
MSAVQIIFIALVFVSITLVVMVALSLFTPSPVRKRLQMISSGDAGSNVSTNHAWLANATRLAGHFAKLSVPDQGWEQSALRLRFMHAGYRSPHAMLFYFAAKTLLTVGLPGLLFLLLQFAQIKLASDLLLALLLLVAALAYYLPNLILARLIFLRQRQIFESFPDAADLMLVCVQSGLGLDTALQRVTDEIRLKSVALAEELQLVNLEMRAGSSREQALRNLAMRTGVEEVVTFATMLVQADRFGTSIGDSLRVFSEEMRSRRRFRAEELAAKIPLKLLFPLIFFIFPSLMLVLLGPAFIQVYRILMPSLG